MEIMMMYASEGCCYIFPRSICNQHLNLQQGLEFPMLIPVESGINIENTKFSSSSLVIRDWVCYMQKMPHSCIIAHTVWNCWGHVYLHGCIFFSIIPYGKPQIITNYKHSIYRLLGCTIHNSYRILTVIRAPPIISPSPCLDLVWLSNLV